jgi:glycosyltransferase involved in cell wall biosynthesis
MIRLAVVVDSLRVGGAQRLISTFAAHASAYDIQPVIIKLREDDARTVTDPIHAAGVELITIPGSSLLDQTRLKRLTDFFKHEQIDLVQTHLFYANILGTIAAYRAGVPVVATLHSIAPPAGWKSKLIQMIEDYCLRHFATRILAVGNMVADAHAGCYGIHKVDVILNSIPKPQPIQSEQREHLRHEITGNGSKPIVVTVGRFSRAKGYEDMIQAFKLLQEKDVQPILLMVGAGSMFDSIKEQIENSMLSQSVVLAGERADVPQLLASSDVFASSSHREGLPLALLEAMMAGLPVVATSVGDIPNVVTSDTGVIVPPHQPEKLAAALEDLLKNPEKRKAMGRAAQQRAWSEYSVDAWMKKHLALYQEMLASRAEGAGS